MKIDSIKSQIISHVGDSAVIECNLGRNKYATYHGVIKDTYDHIFLVEVKNKTSNFIKSFSYSDVITKTIKIDYKTIAF